MHFNDVIQASSDTVILSIIDTLHQYGFDGLNIFLTWNMDSEFEALIHNLRLALTSNDGLLLTASVSATPAVIADSFQVDEIANNLDFLNVRTSEFDIFPANPFFEQTKFAMESLLVKGAPAHKLNLGIAAYGEEFSIFPSFVDPGLTQIPGLGTYYKVCDGQHPSVWVSYDSIDIISAKVAYIEDNNFGGAFVMPIHLENIDGINCSPGQYSTIQNLRDVMDIW
uniref:chitinase-3-like protein 2 n=1 Tax=Doryrhamphus excisus TaxID=161450 RepID=UPI0025AE8A04|nr:chitinase-3-like protein 2 [Doryrhamphus excisus]